MIREPHFHQFALAELLPFFEQFPTQYLSGERNIKLAYRHLVQPESAVRKLMILVNGRAENMLKWTELAYDFYQQGYDVLLFCSTIHQNHQFSDSAFRLNQMAIS